MTGMAEPQDDPIVAGRPATRRLPSIPHVHAPPRGDEIVHAAEVLIAAKDGPAAVFDCEQVDKLGLVCSFPVRPNLAVNAESRDAAIRVDVQAQVCARLFVFDQVPVLRIALEFHRRQQLPPAGVFVGRGRIAGASVYRCRRRIVAGEVARVDVEAAHDAGDA